MLKLILFLFLLFIFVTVYSFKKRIDNILDALFPPKQKRNTSNQPEELVKCATCGVYLPKHDAVKKIKFNGEIIYFCSKECKNNYKKG